jgi:hypothetical protein
MLDKTKMIASFSLIVICSVTGALLSWFYMGSWGTGLYYGAAIGCGIYAAMMTDTSEKKPRRDHI